MHIPDGMIGPIIFIIPFMIMLPIWAYAGYRLKKTLRSRQVPMMALLAAFSFIIMMFKLPLVLGTTCHATGGAIMGIVLGPWAALVAMTVTLVIQLFVFGDGGVTTLGLNSFNMALVTPMCAYVIYRLLSGRAPVASRRRLAAAVVAAYIAITLSAACMGAEYGVSSILYPASEGYTFAQYPLSLTMPVMVGSHLLLFGVVEALITGLIFAYIQRNDPRLLEDRKSRPAPVKSVNEVKSPGS